jgi:L-iditol 2-dehydrogenase
MISDHVHTFRIPDNVSYELAALAEPLSVLIHAARRANLEAGQTVLVFGVGTIGLLACAVAKAYGAARVVAIDINADRLSFAKANGFASHTFCLPKVDNAKTTEEQLRRAELLVKSALKEFNMRQGFDLVFECSGAASCIQMSCHVSFRPQLCAIL